MRVISLKEHETSVELLTATELDDLLRSDLVKLTPLATGGYGVRPGSVVGTATYRHVSLIIRPKLPLRNLLFLLTYGLGITRWGPHEFPYDVAPDFFEALAWLYSSEVSSALRRGLVRGYISREDALPAPVGVISFDRQFALRQSQPYPIECDYDEFTPDIELNRVIRAAHRLVLRRPGLSDRIYAILRHQLAVFEDVADVWFEPGRVPSPVLNRLTEHWRGAAELARLILEGQTLVDRQGRVSALTFTVDMNRLFERFMTTVVSERAGKAGLGCEAQAVRPFTELVTVHPDLVLTGNGGDLAVGDIKYKETEIANWPHADLYQIFAYCSALGLERGLLIYGGERAPERQRVVRARVEIEIVGVDLSGPPAEILASAGVAADLLIAAATRELPDEELVA
jgi:5-methylcytosine-specific restriction enzyme subunit McrC